MIFMIIPTERLIETMSMESPVQFTILAANNSIDLVPLTAQPGPRVQVKHVILPDRGGDI